VSWDDTPRFGEISYPILGICSAADLRLRAFVQVKTTLTHLDEHDRVPRSACADRGQRTDVRVAGEPV
jgi:hypothetical protein